LIYSYAGIGDTIMFTPALRAIKQAYPTCTITFITRVINHYALKGLPYIDHVVPFERGNILKKLSLIPYITNQDFIFFADWHVQLALLAYTFGHPCISTNGSKVQFRFKNNIKKTIYNKMIQNSIRTWVLDTKNYAAETVGNAVSAVLGISLKLDINRLDITLPEAKDIHKVDLLMKNHGLLPNESYICLSPFTGFEPRNWPIKNTVKLANLLQKKFSLPVILLGPPSKKNTVKDLCSGVNLIGETSFYEMVELIKRAALFIGPDSGTMHIAAAVNTPQIALFSNDFPSRWAPKKNCRAISLGLPCTGCRNEGISSCPTRQCNYGITPEMVLSIAEEEFQRLHLRNR